MNTEQQEESFMEELQAVRAANARFELSSVGFSDPCFIRVSSVAQNRLILVRRTRVVVPASRARSLLSGRGTVAVHGAASDIGEKGVQIEANGGETQIA